VVARGLGRIIIAIMFGMSFDTGEDAKRRKAARNRT
jgi:hypothetical protein